MSTTEKSPSKHSRRFTDDEILGGIRKWTVEHGRPPRWDDWAHASERFPTSMTVYIRFGSFPAAVNKALGLKMNGNGERTYKSGHFHQRWTNEKIIRQIQAWARTYGEPPTEREWRDGGEHWPSTRTVEDHFETFDAALEKAGVV